MPLEIFEKSLIADTGAAFLSGRPLFFADEVSAGDSPACLRFFPAGEDVVIPVPREETYETAGSPGPRQGLGWHAPFSREPISRSTKGRSLGLVGANGSGKSSLLGILSGTDEDYRGKLKRKARLRGGLRGPELRPAPRPRLRGHPFSPGAGPGRQARGPWRGTRAPRGPRAWSEPSREYGELRSRYETFGAEEARERAVRLLRPARAWRGGGPGGLPAVGRREEHPFPRRGPHGRPRAPHPGRARQPPSISRGSPGSRSSSGASAAPSSWYRITDGSLTRLGGRRARAREGRRIRRWSRGLFLVSHREAQGRRGPGPGNTRPTAGGSSASRPS